jgi:hypothetical protein
MNQVVEAASPSNEYSKVACVQGRPKGYAQQLLGKHDDQNCHSGTRVRMWRR